MRTFILVILAVTVMWVVLDQMALQDISERLEMPSANDRVDRMAASDADLPPEPMAIAVLPFDPLSNGPDDDYLITGITEEIATGLSRVAGFSVYPDRSAAGYTLEGSAFRAGDRLQITASLSDNANGTNLWSQDYHGNNSDTMEFLYDITNNVCAALGVSLDELQRIHLRDLSTLEVEAFIAYQKGKQLFDRAHAGHNQISSLRQANRHFDTATRIDPLYMSAHLKHADLSKHILFSHASGRLDGNIDSDDVAQAATEIADDYDRAIVSARSETLKRNAQIDRAILLGKWNGLGQELNSAHRRITACIPEKSGILKFKQAIDEALRGEEAEASRLFDQLINEGGPDDGLSLVLYAVQGRLHEANRLASQIDRRLFGHMVLFQAVHDCACGAPFSLSAAPEFAAMLEQSGMEWPPAKRFEYPLKEW